jgi:hypothetical protein
VGKVRKENLEKSLVIPRFWLDMLGARGYSLNMTKFAADLNRDDAISTLVTAGYTKRDAGKLLTEARNLAFVIKPNLTISCDRLNRYAVTVK